MPESKLINASVIPRGLLRDRLDAARSSKISISTASCIRLRTAKYAIINQSGDFAFTASMQSATMPLRRGVFCSSGPSIQKLVDQDSEVPGLAGFKFTNRRTDLTRAVRHAQSESSMPDPNGASFVSPGGAKRQ